MTADGKYNGAALATKGPAVIVTLNYRLGAAGFFPHPAFAAENEHGASGNYGLLDQIAALRWIRTHIEAFGGDPSNVALFGQSAGSYDTCALVASPLASGLFHRAIMQSGPCWIPTVANRDALVDYVSREFGCGSDDVPTEEAAECLRSVGPDLHADDGVRTETCDFWDEIAPE